MGQFNMGGQEMEDILKWIKTFMVIMTAWNF